jgi:hypothetical protein
MEKPPSPLNSRCPGNRSRRAGAEAKPYFFVKVETTLALAPIISFWTILVSVTQKS